MTDFRGSAKPVDFPTPPLNAVLAYRGVWALCDVVGKPPEFRLRCTHYAAVLNGGPQPTWGVWTIGGRFVRFFPRRSAIADAYPKSVWRHKQATWSLADVHDLDEAERRAQLERLYAKGRQLTGREIDEVLTDRDPSGENVVELRRA